MKFLGVAIVAGSLAIGGWVRASELEIIGFDAGQGLQFQGGTISNFYTLEFAPTLDGPWTNWGSVSSATITGTVMSLPSPFFYRIVETRAGDGRPANEPSWTAASNSVVYTNDSRLTDARSPLAHTQAWGSITDAPAIPSTNGLARLEELTNTMALASLALPAAATTGWETGSHVGLLTMDSAQSTYQPAGSYVVGATISTGVAPAIVTNAGILDITVPSGGETSSGKLSLDWMGNLVLTSSNPLVYWIGSISNDTKDLSENYFGDYTYCSTYSNFYFFANWSDASYIMISNAVQTNIYIGDDGMLAGYGWLYKYTGDGWVDTNGATVYVDFWTYANPSIGRFMGDGTGLSGVAKTADLAAYVRYNNTSNMPIDMNGGVIKDADGFAAGTDSIPKSSPFPNAGGPKAGLFMKDRGVMMFGPSNAYGAGSIALGVGIRTPNRAELWLNAAMNSNGDNSADIYFGSGTNMADSNIFWTVSSRPHYQPGSHDQQGRFVIYQGPGALGDHVPIAQPRISIMPDIGILLGSRIPWDTVPFTNSTVTVQDGNGWASLHIQSYTNKNNNAVSRLSLMNSTNGVSLWYRAMDSNFYMTAAGSTAHLFRISSGGHVYVPSLALGTNSAISNWPAGGSKAMAKPASIIVAADYTVPDDIRAIGADTTANDIAVTLPDSGGGFRSLLIRKFSAANTLSILRGTTVLHTLRADGAALEYDWWPDRTNWYLRSP